ncbi:AAA ATPase [Bachmanniomyces sp. S44760]|nr:AAA ATPase [Bachmanniomyces sp. S44760]
MKRSRSQASIFDSPPAKRRTRSSVVDDKDVNSAFVIHASNEGSEDATSATDEVPVLSKTSANILNNCLTPIKHSVNNSYIACADVSRNYQSNTERTGHYSESQPKDINVIQTRTPKTPRHRDALSKGTPVTPRHKVNISGKPAIPWTPKTPISPANVPTIYSSARQLFLRGANPGRLIGREEERDKLTALIQGSVESRNGGCIYISGPPGTGKSALVDQICNAYQDLDDMRVAHINCMSVKSQRDIYEKLFAELCEQDTTMERGNMAQLKAMFLPRKNTPGPVYLVTLDEIDHLLTLDLEILYTLFEWALHRSSRLILIGIANALDLTDRFLPRLKTRNLKPQLLPFLPYTVPQISSVITTKLKSLKTANSDVLPDYIPFLHPAAIQFCSKKVAAQTGDLRDAFDLVRKAIDLAESETRQKHQQELQSRALVSSPSKAPLCENQNLSSPRYPMADSKCTSDFKRSLNQLTPESAPRVTIAHIARVFSLAFGNCTAERLRALNLQQKASLCALFILESRNQKKDIFATPSKSAHATPTVRKIYETYCGLCKRENALYPLTATEFTDVLGSLETQGLVGGAEGKGTAGRLGLGQGKLTPSKRGGRAEERPMVCFVNSEELRGCLNGVGGGILMAFLHGSGS